IFCSTTLLSVRLADPSFFFRAEDGIRDRNVTGVQTCALPICSYDRVFVGGLSVAACSFVGMGAGRLFDGPGGASEDDAARIALRSEERRVGKEGGDRGGRGHENEDGDRPEGVRNGGVGGSTGV